MKLHIVFVQAWTEVALAHKVNDLLYREIATILPDLQLGAGLKWSQKHDIIWRFYKGTLEPWYAKAVASDLTGDLFLEKSITMMFSNTNKMYIRWFTGATFADELASDKDYSPEWIAFINFIKTVPLALWLYKEKHGGREYSSEYGAPSFLIAAEGTQTTKSNFGPLLALGALAVAAYMFSR